MNPEIQTYNNSLPGGDREICNLLSKEISKSLPEAENKIWHGHPVWFLNGNPIVGYRKLKDTYDVRYTIWVNSAWEVLSFSIEGQISGKKNQVTLQSDGTGNWKTREGHLLEQFNDCIDIDIPLTPFTNSFPSDG